MSHIKFFQTHKPSIGSIRVCCFKQAAICLALLLSLGLLNSCSDDDGDPDTSEPHSVRVAETNQNLFSGGTITSEFSDSPSESDISKAVDSDIATKFITSHSKFYILWKGDKTETVNYYAITSSDGNPKNDPQTWTLYGSQNKQQWAVIDSQTDQIFTSRQEKKEFLTTNDVAYIYYKLEIEKNNGGKATEIAELFMLYVISPDVPYGVEISNTNHNLPSGGRLTAEFGDFPSESHIGKAVDNDPHTKFVTNHSNFYILWAGNTKASINYYSITSSDSPSGAPEAWSFCGSDDGVNWTDLDVQTGQIFAENQKKEYEIDNEYKYKYYELLITGNGGSNTTEIAELVMQWYPRDFNDLMIYSEGNSHNPNTPMGNYYGDERRLQKSRNVTATDLAWLKDPNVNPRLDGDMQGSWERKTVSLFPFGEPVPSDINQGSIGDCSALAVFASMAYIYPGFVKTLIDYNPNDGSYTVHMYDAYANKVDVVVNNEFLTSSQHGKRDVANWATILEKAIIKWRQVFDLDTNIGGIGSENVAPLFTGDGGSFAFYSGRVSGQDLARIARVSLLEGRIIVGGFSQGNIPIEGTGTKTVSGHAWTIMHSPDPEKLFTMRNPWGGNYDVSGDDGLVDIPDNDIIPKLIDFRIINPGAAGSMEYGSGVYEPYTPPAGGLSQDRKMRQSHL